MNFLHNLSNAEVIGNVTTARNGIGKCPAVIGNGRKAADSESAGCNVAGLVNNNNNDDVYNGHLVFIRKSPS